MAGIPAAVALLSLVFLRETLSRRMLAAIALAVAGIVVLAFTRAGPDDAPPQRSAWCCWLAVFARRAMW